MHGSGAAALLLPRESGVSRPLPTWIRRRLASPAMTMTSAMTMTGGDGGGSERPVGGSAAPALGTGGRG